MEEVNLGKLRAGLLETASGAGFRGVWDLCFTASWLLRKSSPIMELAVGVGAVETEHRVWQPPAQTPTK